MWRPVDYAAEPSQVSALAGNLAINLALGQGELLVSSVSRCQDELNARMLSTVSEVNLQAFVSKEYNEERRNKAMKSMALNMPKLVNAPIHIEPRTDITINQIRAEARRMVRNNGIKAVFVDYLQLVGTRGNNNNRVQEVGQISRG